MEFGKYLKTLRLRKGLIANIFAEKIGLHPTHLSDIEAGRRLPPDDFQTLDAIAGLLGLSTSERHTLFDLAAEKREITPPDLSKYISGNKQVTMFLRKAEAQGYRGKDFRELSKILDERKRRDIT